MVRRRPPFEFTAKRGYRCNLDSEERYLLQRLLGEVRELLSTSDPDDPKMVRLFPPAYDRDDDAAAQDDYRRLMHEELVASRLDSLAQFDAVLSDDGSDTMTEQQMHSMATSLNSVRLILGTLIGVVNDDEGAEDVSVGDGANAALYDYLSWLLENAVQALMHGNDMT